MAKKIQSFGFLNYRRGVAGEKPVVLSSSKNDDDNILNEIYAPDPNTGFPRSDISVMLSRSTDPVVREFVNKVIMSPIPSNNVGDNPDIALELIRGYEETEEMYISRLKGIISENNE